MQFLSKHNEQVRKVVFENAPKNLKYTSSDIQKDLVRACAIDTIDAIFKDMEGEAIEKFLGVQHVSSTTSSSLEEAIERLLATTNLSMSKLQEQGYDGASNMRALVFVAKENEDVANFFINASSLVNLIGLSYKRRDAFREKQQEQIQKALDLGNLETAVVEVVEWIKSHCNQDNLGKATRLFKDIQTFDFTFHLFLMTLILGITNELSQALQKKDQDIVNVMTLMEYASKDYNL
ncbi:uncharacterized protein LOC125473147 [Pyrus x bretschneideri]|uniref:uncharacterized protein LOC125473147 n=1 Tax=Pyrus x bretschneideri TaxID=225117 RepID=UPI0020307052|nr:uncharacterized protein LOC125473147 [Pyrus x bretschneideri]